MWSYQFWDFLEKKNLKRNFTRVFSTTMNKIQWFFYFWNLSLTAFHRRFWTERSWLNQVFEKSFLRLVAQFFGFSLKKAVSLNLTVKRKNKTITITHAWTVCRVLTTFSWPQMCLNFKIWLKNRGFFREFNKMVI